MLFAGLFRSERKKIPDGNRVSNLEKDLRRWQEYKLASRQADFLACIAVGRSGYCGGTSPLIGRHGVPAWRLVCYALIFRGP
jgi:predicted nucleic acid-binding Zn ribbon protein